MITAKNVKIYVIVCCFLLLFYIFKEILLDRSCLVEQILYKKAKKIKKRVYVIKKIVNDQLSVFSHNLLSMKTDKCGHPVDLLMPGLRVGLGWVPRTQTQFKYYILISQL